MVGVEVEVVVVVEPVVPDPGTHWPEKDNSAMTTKLVGVVEGN